MPVKVFGEYTVPCADQYLCQSNGSRWNDILQHADSSAMNIGGSVGHGVAASAMNKWNYTSIGDTIPMFSSGHMDNQAKINAACAVINDHKANPTDLGIAAGFIQGVVQSAHSNGKIEPLGNEPCPDGKAMPVAPRSPAPAPSPALSAGGPSFLEQAGDALRQIIRNGPSGAGAASGALVPPPLWAIP